MRSTLLAAVAASLLLSVTAVEVGAAAPVTPAGRVRVVHREYGDGPVRVGTAAAVTVSFHGRPGDRVRLAGSSGCPVSLRGPRGDRPAMMPDGFWRLARRGVQTFTLRSCDRLQPSSKVQLEKRRLRHVAVDGPGVALPHRRGYVDAVRVRVPDSGRLQLKGVDDEPGIPFAGMVLPDGTWYPLTGWATGDTYFFEAGRPVSGTLGRLRGAGGHGSLIVHAGDAVTFIASARTTVWESVAKTVPVSVDAPATTLSPSEVPYREYAVEFDAVAGTWLETEIVGPTGGLYDRPRLLGPHGHQYDRPFLQIPTTGRWRLVVPTAPTTESTQVRIRTITQAGVAVRPDGTHLTLTADQPGEWVLAPMTLDQTQSFRLSSHAAVASGDWEALATVQRELNCPRRSMGCGEFSFGTVSTPDSSSEPFGGYGPDWVVLLIPRPGVTATVDLSVAPVT